MLIHPVKTILCGSFLGLESHIFLELSAHPAFSIVLNASAVTSPWAGSVYLRPAATME